MLNRTTAIVHSCIATILVLLLLLVSIMPCGVVVAQVEPSPTPELPKPSKPVITYTHPGWQLQKTNGYETVDIVKLDNKAGWEFTVHPTNLLTARDKTDYPIKVYEWVSKEQGPGLPLVWHWELTKDPQLSKQAETRTDLNLDNTFTLPDIEYDKMAGVAIKFGAHSSTITYAGGSVNTYGDLPDFFEEIYQADIAGGWGVVTKPAGCSNCYCVKKWIKSYPNASSGISTIADSGCHVTFVRNFPPSQVFNMYAGVTANFGEIESESSRTTSNGISFALEDNIPFDSPFRDITSTGTANYYSCMFRWPKQGDIDGANRVWNCDLTNYIGLENVPDSSGGSVYNTVISNAYWSIRNPKGPMEDVKVHNGEYGIGVQSLYQTTYFQNLVLRDCVNPILYGLAIGGIDSYYTDCDLDDWTSTWSIASGTETARYTTNLLVKGGSPSAPIEGASVVWTDAYGTVVQDVLTGVSGTAPATTLIDTVSTQAHHFPGTPAMVCNPHTLTIAYPGMGTYTAIVTADKPIDFEITLLPVGCSASDMIIVDWLDANGDNDLLLGWIGDNDDDSLLDWVISFLEDDMESIFQVLLFGLVVGVACWRRELFLWLAAAIGTGFLSAIWWEESMNYGLPAALVSVVLLWKAIQQVIDNRIRL